jgi:glucosylceramidase
MNTECGRRDFLKFNVLGLAAGAAARIPAVRELDDALADPSGKIEVWITDQKLRCAQSEAIDWRPASRQPSSRAAILLSPNQTYQTILGFGAAFTDAACYMLNQLSQAAREQLFDEMFHPSQMGLNVCRTCMGSSDYSTKVYSYDEGDADPELNRFSINHDREYILPMLKLARSVNPELFVFSSPWSPPGWMKSGGSMLGGRCDEDTWETMRSISSNSFRHIPRKGCRAGGHSPKRGRHRPGWKNVACIWPQGIRN